MVIDHPILVFYEAFFCHNRAAQIAGLPPRLTSFRIISSEEKKSIFGTTTLFLDLVGPSKVLFGPFYLMQTHHF